MNYLLDGYNIAHWLAPGDHDLDAHGLRALLIAQLAGRVPHDAVSVTIFWDVRNPNPSIPPREFLDWCVMQNVPDADAAIIEAVYQADKPSRCLVVSRDREVTGKSRQLGARTQSPKQLFDPRSKP
ncbi:MAG: hypothetical protein DHS20C15_14580 [Planctomycetota bacterium]|nr:MAG: hypothetical protein DHS20C15_14580 [Planctomycetota bacterium]